MKPLSVLAVASVVIGMLLPVSAQKKPDHIKYLTNTTSGSFRFSARNDQTALSLDGQIITGTTPTGEKAANLWLILSDCQLVSSTCKSLWANLPVPPEFVTLTGQDSISVNIPDITAFVDQYSEFWSVGFPAPISANFTVTKTNESRGGGTYTTFSQNLQGNGTTKSERFRSAFTFVSAKASGEVAGYVLPQPESDWSVIWYPNSGGLRHDTSKCLEIPW